METIRGSKQDSTPDAEVRQVLIRKTRKSTEGPEAVLHLKRKQDEYQMAGVMKAPPAGLEVILRGEPLLVQIARRLPAKNPPQ